MMLEPDDAVDDEKSEECSDPGESQSKWFGPTPFKQALENVVGSIRRS